jgi:hypothetical protein
MARRALALAAWVAELGCVVAALGCVRQSARPAGVDAAGLRREIEALRQRVDERLTASPHVQQILDRHPASEVVVGLRMALVEDVVREVGRAYLDRVELDLDLERTVDEQREVEVDTPFGKVVAGEWRLHVTIHRVRAVLRARTPELKPAGTNQIAARVPVILEGAEGTATARFTWDAHSVASVVCRDFDARRQVRGRIAADEYTLVGRFDLSSAPNAVRVQPVFPRRRFHVRVDLADQSWADVRRALEDQDEVLKCGLALDPDAILPRLRARLAEGFDLDLPSSIFRPVDLPAGLRQSVAVEDTEVDLAVQTDALRVEPEAVWYAAGVRSRLRASGAQ